MCTFELTEFEISDKLKNRLDVKGKVNEGVKIDLES